MSGNMQAKNVILNPDDFLGSPRIWTPERNQAAWEKIYEILENGFKSGPARPMLYIVCGVQGSGKTTLIKEEAFLFEENAFIVDAALPGKRHRARAIEIAKRFAVPVEAIWIDTKLQTALQRNSLRVVDERVSEEAIKNVSFIFEIPCTTEGFRKVHRIASDADEG